MTKRILFLSYYFPPDLSAGAFRSESLVKALLAEAGTDVHVDVITTQPNRYHGFSSSAPAVEDFGGYRVRRIGLPCNEGRFKDQARNFLVFARAALRLTKEEDYDLIVATSSRLMTGALGAWIARCKGSVPFYLDVRDILVDSLSELFPARYNWLLIAAFSMVERLTLKQASRVNLISPGFLSYFAMRYPSRQFSLHTNGVDELFLDALPRQRVFSRPGPAAPLQVLYAGNIGTGQGLQHILPTLAKKLEGKVDFRIIGAGGALNELAKALSALKVTNVELLPPVRRDALVFYYQNADILFLHLNRFDAFRRVLPSKLFEYAATGKPIWAGVSGYPAVFAKKNIANVAVFLPCDVEGALISLQELDLGDVCRSEFVEVYSRAKIQKAMAREVLCTSGSSGER